MNLVALPLVVLAFLLPGFAWLLLSGLTKRLNAPAALVFSFILSICFLSVASASLSLLTSEYLVYTTAGALALPAIAMVVYFRRHGFGNPFAKESSISPLVLLCLVVFALFLAAYFWSTPYYPAAPAADALAHAQFTQNISNGNGRSVLLQSNYPVGLHFTSAIVMTLLGLNALESLNILSSLVLITSPILIFEAAHALFHNENLAALTAVVGTLILPVDAMHFILIGTYPNMVEDAIILVAIFLFFSYLKEPCVSIGLTLALVGVAGFFVHSSFVLFLAVLWLLWPVVYLLFRGNRNVRMYFHACVFVTVGIFFVALVALPFLKSNLGRVLGSYSITKYIGGASSTQVLQSLVVVYETLAWNIVFLVKPLNTIAIVLGFVLVVVKARQSTGRIFVAGWFAIIVILSLVSGQTDRFVLFSMVPAMFLMGNLVGNIPALRKSRFQMIDRKIVLAGVLIVLVVFGGFVSLLPVAFDPSRRSHQQNIVASMDWLQQNQRLSGIASLGMSIDYRYLPILASVRYSGSLPYSATPDEALQESKVMQFACVVMQANNSATNSFGLSQAFQERFQNTEIVIFCLTSQSSGTG
jgi:hypothetical protein